MLTGNPQRSTFLISVSGESSFLCHLAANIGLFYLILEPIGIFLLSFARLMLVWYPFDSKFKETDFCVKVLCRMLGMTFVVSSGFGVLFHFIVKTFPTSLCFASFDPSSFSLVLQITATALASYQLSMSPAVLASHCFIGHGIKESAKATKAQGKTNVGKGTVTKLVFGSVSNLVCWLPASIIFLVIMITDRFPLDLMSWTLVAVVPVQTILSALGSISISLHHHTIHKMKNEGIVLNHWTSFLFAFASCNRFQATHSELWLWSESSSNICLSPPPLQGDSYKPENFDFLRVSVSNAQANKTCWGFQCPRLSTGMMPSILCLWLWCQVISHLRLSLCGAIPNSTELWLASSTSNMLLLYLWLGLLWASF